MFSSSGEFVDQALNALKGKDDEVQITDSSPNSISKDCKHKIEERLIFKFLSFSVWTFAADVNDSENEPSGVWKWRQMPI